MAYIIESAHTIYEPTSTQKPQPYNPYPTHEAVVIFYIMCQAQERIANFDAPLPIQFSFPMGITQNLAFPREPVGGTCEITYLRREHKYESLADHFRISNSNFFRGWDFYVTVYTSPSEPNSPPFSVIRQHEKERYGWHGKIESVYGKIGIMWTKHIVNRSIPETPPLLTPRLQKRHRQAAGRTFACTGAQEWLTIFRRSYQTTAQIYQDIDDEEISISDSPVTFRRPSISSGTDNGVSTEDG